MKHSNRRQRKALVRELAAKGDEAGLIALSEGQARHVASHLLGLTFTRNDGDRWRTIALLGRLCGAMAETDLDGVREIIRRIIWNMRDESGGLAWNGPETMAEIVTNVPVLFDEYASIIASFLHEPPFGPGAMWAMARLAPIKIDPFVEHTGDVERALSASDPTERAYALLALAGIAPKRARAAAAKLRDDKAEVSLFDCDTRQMYQVNLAWIAEPLAGTRRKSAPSRGGSKAASGARPQTSAHSC